MFFIVTQTTFSSTFIEIIQCFLFFMDLDRPYIYCIFSMIRKEQQEYSTKYLHLCFHRRTKVIQVWNNMTIQFEVTGHYTYFNSDLFESCVSSLFH